MKAGSESAARHDRQTARRRQSCFTGSSFRMWWSTSPGNTPSAVMPPSVDWLRRHCYRLQDEEAVVDSSGGAAAD